MHDGFIYNEEDFVDDTSLEKTFKTYVNKLKIENDYYSLRGDLYDEEYYWNKEYLLNDEIIAEFDNRKFSKEDFSALLKSNLLEEYEELFCDYQRTWFIVNFASKEIITDSYYTDNLNILNMIEMLLIIWKSEKSEKGVEITVKNINDKKATVNDKELSTVIKTYLFEKCNSILGPFTELTREETIEILLSGKENDWLRVNNFYSSEYLKNLECGHVFEIAISEYSSTHKKTTELTLEHLKSKYLYYSHLIKNHTKTKGAKPYNTKTGELALMLYNLYQYNIDEKKATESLNPRLLKKASAYKFIYEYFCYWGVIKDIYDEFDDYHKTSYIKSLLTQIKKSREIQD